MHDSITAADIPRDAHIVAGYVSGRYKWSPADWARFPNATKVRIATSAAVDDGHVLDVEPGDATPGEAPGWVQMRRRAGVDPTVYCNLGALPAVRAAFAAAGVAQPHYWVARYDNVPAVPAGAVAKQYCDPATSGGHYDLSCVADYWPGVDPAPVAVNINPLAEDGGDMELEPGTQRVANLPLNGRRQIWVGTSFRKPDAAEPDRKVLIHQIVFFGPTKYGTNAPEYLQSDYDLGSGDPARVAIGIDPGRPGPLNAPTGAVYAAIRYSTNVDNAVVWAS